MSFFNLKLLNNNSIYGGSSTCSIHPILQSFHRYITQDRSKSAEMAEENIKLVKDFIDSDYVVIFSKSYCPYCKMAKEVFDKMNHKYTTIELDERDDADEIQSVLGQITGAKTVPRVFVKGQCIGGGTDVKKMYETGELKSLMEK